MRKTAKPQAVEQDTKRLAAATSICFYGVILGTAVLLFGLATTWTTVWGASMVPPSATLIVAGIAGTVTIRSVVTWSEQRGRDAAAGQYRHREEVYGKILKNMMKSFAGQKAGSDAEAKLRALATLWAAPATLEALARRGHTRGH